MSPTLYEQAPATWDALADKGFPSIRDAAKKVHTCMDLDFAVGMNGAAHHWIKGKNASHKAERAAAFWLHTQNNPKPPDPVAPPPPAADILLVAVPAGNMAKVQRVLAVLGCEVIE